MTLNIKFQSKPSKQKTVVFPLYEDKKFSGRLSELDKKVKGLIKKSIASADFEAKQNKHLSIFIDHDDYDRVIISGLGKEKQDNPEVELKKFGSSIQQFLNHAKIKNAEIAVESPIYNFAQGVAAAHIAFGAELNAYRFDKYFTKQKNEDKASLKELSFVLAGDKEAQAKFEVLKAIADGVYLARDLVSEPPNVLYPESYANIIKEQFKGTSAKVEILDKKALEKIGMGALLGVAQGSVKDARVVIVNYQGSSDKKEQPVAFVGKGVTFDTGGISLKPSQGMEDMKYDMGGSATVIGVMKSLVGRSAKVNAIGIVGLVENMPDGNAQRPSDVVTSLSGQTIEVLNTDAEGRLVLADILWYCQDKYNPKFMVDLATLTGACVIALGQHKAGLMSNDDKLADQIFKSGEAVSENVWRLPMGDEYDKQIDSKIADVQNISSIKGAGTITAAQFLQRFVNGKKWAHLDIAGVAWEDKGKPTVPAGAVGFGVQALDRMIADNYEN